MFLEGQKIGGYTLLQKLGKGGFGEVWLAEKHSQFVTKKVAVKLPFEEQVSFDAIRQEAQLWEQASGHPNVLPIIDADIIDGQVLIVSEYANGGSLADKISRDGRVALKEAVGMTIGILNGLEYLHSQKIIHRDIKPQNILLQGDMPRLADFGISRAMSTTVKSSTIIGTDAYMSPEAFDGKRSIQTDIWSVGVVLYQLLTGELPFPQEHPTERMFAVLTKDFEPLPAEIPESLRNIVRKVLAKKPEDRYQTTAEMRDELQSAFFEIAHPTSAATEVLGIQRDDLPTVPVIEPETEKETIVRRSNIHIPAPTEPVFVPRPPADIPRPDEPLPSFSPAFLEAKSGPTVGVTKTRSAFLAVLGVLLGVLLLGGITVGLYFGYQKLQGGGDLGRALDERFNGLTKKEMELLLEDANPVLLKRLAENSQEKKQQVDNLKQLFALASEAQKDNSIYTTNARRALEFIDSAVWAQSYDQEIRKNKGATEAFGLITEEQINAFYGEGEPSGIFGNSTARRRKAELDQFVALNIEITKKNNAVKENAPPSEEELRQYRQQLAQVKIYDEEARQKVKEGAVSPKFLAKTELQSKLQRAQFLARQYQEVLAKRTEVTDADIAKYIAEHPELNVAAGKKAKAEDVLKRALAGEDFAALAKKFSEDPGSKDKGGLYEGVVKDQMVPEFENAALALQPGQMSPALVETNYGYHIIKLIKKGETRDSDGQVKLSYDVRHILLSTMVKDPNDPNGKDVPVKEHVKTKLQAVKEKEILDKLVASNPVSIAEDFTIPRVSEDDIKKQQSQSNPAGGGNSTLLKK
ncbi:MAG: protein kinase [Acidobacteria bacterium]|nr:protein kinase [Acidobacteriota bacterium]